MAFLTIAGVDYDVSQSDAGERSPRVVGATVETFNGGLRSSRRARKRVWGFTLGPMAVTTSETLINNTFFGAVAVTGDAINGAALNAIVDVTQIQFVSNLDEPKFHKRLVQVTVSEV